MYIFHIAIGGRPIGKPVDVTFYCGRLHQLVCYQKKNLKTHVTKHCKVQYFSTRHTAVDLYSYC